MIILNLVWTMLKFMLHGISEANKRELQGLQNNFGHFYYQLLTSLILYRASLQSSLATYPLHPYPSDFNRCFFDIQNPKSKPVFLQIFSHQVQHTLHVDCLAQPWTRCHCMPLSQLYAAPGVCNLLPLSVQCYIYVCIPMFKRQFKSLCSSTSPLLYWHSHLPPYSEFSVT